MDRASVAIVKASTNSFAEAFDTKFFEYVLALTKRERSGGSFNTADMIVPVACKRFDESLRELAKHCNECTSDGLEFPSELLPLLRTVVGWRRRRDAVELEAKARLTFSGELRQRLHEELRRYDRIVTASWFDRTPPAAVPKLSDFFSIEVIEMMEAKQ